MVIGIGLGLVNLFFRISVPDTKSIGHGQRYITVTKACHEDLDVTSNQAGVRIQSFVTATNNGEPNHPCGIRVR